MQYLGGKSRLAGQIRDAIISHVGDTTGRTYWEPFLGGAGAFDRIAPAFERAVGSDIHPDVAALWQAVFQEGWVPPESVTEDEYQAARGWSEPSALRGFIGFGCSFGGKWFGGYARSSGRDHPNESRRNVIRSRDRIVGNVPVTILNCGFKDITPAAGDVVYCDPPYADTTGYTTGGFDHAEFWAWADELTSRGVRVFVSELTAPEGWVCIWSKTRSVTVTSQGGPGANKKVVDALYTRC